MCFAVGFLSFRAVFCMFLHALDVINCLIVISIACCKRRKSNGYNELLCVGIGRLHANLSIVKGDLAKFLVVFDVACTYIAVEFSQSKNKLGLTKFFPTLASVHGDKQIDG